jgi:hypothetical protein
VTSTIRCSCEGTRSSGIGTCKKRIDLTFFSPQLISRLSSTCRRSEVVCERSLIPIAMQMVWTFLSALVERSRTLAASDSRAPRKAWIAVSLGRVASCHETPLESARMTARVFCGTARIRQVFLSVGAYTILLSNVTYRVGDVEAERRLADIDGEAVGSRKRTCDVDVEVESSCRRSLSARVS